MTLLFPRYVFTGTKTQLVESQDAYDSALDMGWFGTVGEAQAAPTPSEPWTEAIVADLEPIALDAPPTREELEAKAAELGLKFHPNTGDIKLAALIAAKLEG